MKRFALMISVPPHILAACGLEVLEHCLDCLQTHPGPALPVAWNLSTTMICERGDPQAGAIRSRIEERVDLGDRLIPMGLTGASHRFLHGDEILSELEWGVSNIWMTGGADAFSVEPELVLPADGDPGRRTALDAYRRSGVPVGVVGRSEDGEWLVLVPGAGESASRSAPMITTSLTVKDDSDRAMKVLARELPRRLRRHAGAEPELIVLRVTVGSSPERQLLPAIAAAQMLLGKRWEASALGSEHLSSKYQPAPVVSGTPIVSRAATARAAGLRKRRASRINTRRVLESLVALDETEESDSGPEIVDQEREVVASMMGQALIAGDTTSALFNGGRFVSFVDATARTDSLSRAGASILVIDDEHHYRSDLVQSCVSVESRESRGLFVESTIMEGTDPWLEVRSEYVYAGDHDALLFSVSIRPSREENLAVASELTSVYPICLPIGRPEDLSFQTVHTDGSERYVSSREWPAEGIVAGAAIEIGDGAAPWTLVFLDRDGSPLIGACAIVHVPASRPEVRIALGGALPIGALAVSLGATGWAEYDRTGLLIPGGLDGDLVQRALSKRLPRAILHSLRLCGTAPARAERLEA